MYKSLLRFLALLTLSVLMSFGLVVLANGMQIYSYRRFLIYALWLAPLVALFIFLGLKYLLPIDRSLLKQKSFRIAVFWIALLALAAAVGLAPTLPDTLRYFVAVLSVAVLFLVVGLAALLLFSTDREKFLTAPALVFFALLGLAGFGLFWRMAFWTRLYGDDFCYQNLVLTRGYLQTLEYFYFNWSGRLLSGVVAFGIRNANIGILLQLSAIFVALFICAYLFYPPGKPAWRRLAWSLACAALLPFLIFALTPDPYKSIYWVLAASGYLPLLVLLPFYLLLVYRTFQVSQPKTILYAILAFGLAVGLTFVHEVASFPIVAMNFGFLLLLAFNPDKSRAKWVILGAGFAGSLAGSAAAVLAPGNFARHIAQAYPEFPGLFSLLQLNTRFAEEYLVSRMGNDLGLYLAAAFFLGYLGPGNIRGRWTAPLAILLLTGLMVWLTFLSGVYAAQASVPTRVQIIPTMILVIGSFFAGLAAPLRSGRPLFLAALAMYLLVSPFFYRDIISEKAALAPPLMRFAQDWDERDQILRTTDLSAYRIAIPWDAWEQEFSCTQEYYRIIRNP